MTTFNSPRRIDPRSFAAAQSFITGVKIYWHKDLFGTLRSEYEHRVDVSGKAPQTVDDVEKIVAGMTTYRYYGWFERHMQKFKYAGRYGLIPWHQQERERLEKELAQKPIAPLELDPQLEMPRYYVNCDIHQHPGGVWSDPVAGFVYERASSTTTPLAGELHADMHERFTRLLEENCPAPQRVLDMGCGFGKSTGPIAAHFPQAQVDAVDLAAPVLEVAARRTKNVRFRQMDATRTDYPDGHFDLVTSTMLLHEMPPPVIEKTLAEAARVLHPGGKMVHLDFHNLRDPFARFIHYTHGRRNNEPFMEPLAEMDIAALLGKLGFKNVKIEPFAEAEGVLSPEFRAWRFPWTTITAERV